MQSNTCAFGRLFLFSSNRSRRLALLSARVSVSTLGRHDPAKQVSCGLITRACARCSERYRLRRGVRWAHCRWTATKGAVRCGAAADSSARPADARCSACCCVCVSRSVSRDLLQLEEAGATSSPFLISPGGGGGGASFPFAPPPSRQLGHAPPPLPAALAGSSDAAAAAASSAGGNSAAASASAFGSGPPSRLKTFSIPPSSLLSRVQAFLPELAKANAKLEQVGGETRADEERSEQRRRVRAGALSHTLAADIDTWLAGCCCRSSVRL